MVNEFWVDSCSKLPLERGLLKQGREHSHPGLVHQQFDCAERLLQGPLECVVEPSQSLDLHFPILRAPGASSSMRSGEISSGERIKDRAFCDWLMSRMLFQTVCSGRRAEQNARMISSFLIPQRSATMVELSSSLLMMGLR